MVDPKPDIKIDPSSENYHGMRIHVRDLINRYGPNIKFLNLLYSDMNSHKRRSEVGLNNRYQEYYKTYFENYIPNI